MATILLQAAGGVVGGLLGGPFGAMAGRALGALGGAAIDSRLFGPGTRRVEGPRLGASRLLDADEGGGIARLYGTARIAGQVIWATRFEETSQTERSGGKGGGSQPKTETTTYSYFGNVAIGLCEGPIAGIRRVWADGEELDLSNLTYRVHRGDAAQMPDPLIEAKQGAGLAPAYRGLAYIVFERLALESFGNRIPQIACEVIRPVGDLEGEIRAITIIPGASEHGLDPLAVRETLRPGEDRIVNRTVRHAPSDFEGSLDELQSLCPRLERAALVVGWFGTDLRAGSCEVRPGVEAAQRNESETWRVGGTARAGGHRISWSGGGPAYGGTPSDRGVIRAIRDLKARGLKVTLYPFLLMDVPAGNALPDPYGGPEQAAYPWRGRMTVERGSDRTAGARTAVERFVGKVAARDYAVAGDTITYQGPAEWSLRRMVLHQAHLALAAGGVDAFVIASELRGLTRLRDETGAFPFVSALMALAAEVKALLPDTKITYAADWSEYFGYRPADGSGDLFYNLDPLWAHPAIDMVGIDNYLPLSDWRIEDAGGASPDGAETPHDLGALGRGVAGGEYADWFYASEADRQARRRTPITDGAAGKPWVFRPKDILDWWRHPHVERRGGVETGGATAWVPSGKPIWFTELGCPAIDKGANQPNVFLDPKSSESLAPHFSTGTPDDLMQRRFLSAHLRHWDPAQPEFQDAGNPISPVYGGRMVEPSGVHVWTWDTRPYPAFPERADIWSDGANWRRGHWLTGRLGRAPVSELIRRLLAEHGFTEVDTSRVDALVGGYLVSGPGSARAELEELMRLCAISAHASGGRLVFTSLDRAAISRQLDVLAEETGDGSLIEQRRMEDSETAEEVVVGYSDPARAYQSAAAEALRSREAHPRKTTIELPVILDEGEARRFASAVLAREADGRDTIRFSASPTEIGLEPGDVVGLGAVPGRFLITRIEDGETRRIEARRIADAAREASDERGVAPAPVPKGPVPVSRPVAVFLDLPLLGAATPAAAPRLAVHARPYVPVRAEVAVPGGAFRTAALALAPATMGVLAGELAPGPEGLIDRGHRVLVDLFRGSLSSVTGEALLAGENLCAVRCRNGGLEVLQFQDAEEIAPGRFRLGRLLRAQGGTEDAMASGAEPGADFVLLDGSTTGLDLAGNEFGRELDWRIVPAGQALDDPAVVRLGGLTLGGRAALPLSPVHLTGRFEADGALSLGFVRRTRTGGDGWEGIDVPLGEEIERYRIRLSIGGAALTVETAEPRARVSAADQQAAFGGLPASISVEACQFSLTAGAGLARRALFRRPA
ncbi:MULTISPECIES: glycoside hydrolase/phage tail family protein [unclassified Aureimonas]|uniref:baseplate multidomain protein megatron n=1 Tax=unclassified Aureimonas TaxID=2615206 RepID=UPI0006F4A25B|nr:MULTISPECIES: glycoside hydrolase/phage tail family protein [unclassified Aureimonas]KQT55274.1 hypothetical protein ASG62_10625 [Aureimonas sp. Leaf427]KQT71066.1 hypothetical protein ASG54_21010 [Aureimonas sp. Leaf460]